MGLVAVRLRRCAGGLLRSSEARIGSDGGSPDSQGCEIEAHVSADLETEGACRDRHRMLRDFNGELEGFLDRVAGVVGCACPESANPIADGGSVAGEGLGRGHLLGEYPRFARHGQ